MYRVFRVHLQDWRENRHSALTDIDDDKSSMSTSQRSDLHSEQDRDSISEHSSQQDPWILQEGTNAPLSSSVTSWDNGLLFGEERNVDSDDYKNTSGRTESPMHKLASTKDSHLADLAQCSSPESKIIVRFNITWP